MAGSVLIAVLVVFFVAWYLAGNELMRRRAHRLALWCHGALDAAGSGLAIRWLTNGAFQIESLQPYPPLQSASLTGLVESLDVPMLWLWRHYRGRRDMILLQLSLERPPVRSLELYQPRSLLAGDARHHARDAGWQEEALDEFRLAPAGPAARAQAGRLLTVLGTQRAGLVRLSLRSQGPHLLLALNLPTRPPEVSLPPG